MSLKKFIILHQRLDTFIRLESTGNPEEFAKKLNISRRHLFNYLNDLRELGYQISYNSTKQSYQYTSEVISKNIG